MSPPAFLVKLLSFAIDLELSPPSPTTSNTSDFAAWATVVEYGGSGSISKQEGIELPFVFPWQVAIFQ